MNLSINNIICYKSVIALFLPSARLFCTEHGLCFGSAMLHRLVANALDMTFKKGDMIAIDMPMTCTAVIIYLAIILAGYIAVTIADSFSANEIATRLRIAKAKGIFTQVSFFTNIDMLCPLDSRKEPIKIEQSVVAHAFFISYAINKM